MTWWLVCRGDGLQDSPTAAENHQRSDIVPFCHGSVLLLCGPYYHDQTTHCQGQFQTTSAIERSARRLEIPMADNGAALWSCQFCNIFLVNGTAWDGHKRWVIVHCNWMSHVWRGRRLDISNLLAQHTKIAGCHPLHGDGNPLLERRQIRLHLCKKNNLWNRH